MKQITQKEQSFISNFRWISLTLCLIVVQLAFSSKDEVRCHYVFFEHNQGVLLDSFIIKPQSIHLQDTSFQNLFIKKGTDSLFISGDTAIDSLLVCYQVYPLLRNYTASYSIEEYDSLTPVRFIELNKSKPNSKDTDELISTPNIQKSGSITRGISAGNNQSSFINSSLNLQMEGKLSDDLRFKAVLSDQDVPFQAEGNTQNIQEFDKVYLEISKGESKVDAGDVIFKEQSDQFLRYHRNAQGAMITLKTGTDSTLKGVSQAGIAVAKGKFSLNTITPIEGVQGPYRLRGANNERFIVVLSNSERVFIDGRPVQRGWDNDYIIDYNLSEITFTSSVLITKYTRIRVEFEYIDRNYVRTTTVLNQQLSNDKWLFDLNYYAEKDNRNQSLLVPLNDFEKQSLSEIGDDYDRALINSFEEASVDQSGVLYWADTTLTDLIFIATTSADSSLFDVQFSDVGVGNGDYIKRNELENEAVYEYKGVGNGQYLPQRSIILPQQKRVLDVQLSRKFNHLTLFTEVAVSDNDLNLFSELGDQDNIGFATKVGFQVDSMFSDTTRKSSNVYSSVFYEHVTSDFRPIDRFRSIEFDRNWNSNSENYAQSDLLTTTIGKRSKDVEVEYSFQFRDKRNEVNGQQHNLDYKKDIGHFSISSINFLLNAKGEYDYSWYKSFNKLSVHHAKLTKGILYNLDKNTAKNGSEVVSTRMYYDEVGGFLSSGDSTKNSWYAQYTYREDSDTLQNELNKGLFSHNALLRTSHVFKNHHLSSIINYRKLEGAALTENQIDENLSGVLNLKSSFFKRSVSSSLVYSNAVVRELQREFIYKKVETGQGNYLFKDYNNNGIQELDEFLLENTYGNYIRLWVPTDTYLNAFENSINYRLSLRFPSSFLKGSSVQKSLYRFSNVTSINNKQRYAGDDVWVRINPFSPVDNEDILAYSRNFKSIFFYNKGNKRYTANLNYNQLSNQQLINSGNQAQIQSIIVLKNNFKIVPELIYTLDLGFRDKVSSSTVFTNTNFHWQGQEIENGLQLQPNAFFRTAYSFNYKVKDDNNLQEITRFNTHLFEVKHIRTSSYVVHFSLKTIMIRTSGDELFQQSPLGYDMLEGLRSGTNFEWQLNIQKNLMKGLLLNFRYQARKPADNNIIHLGSVQLSAVL